MKIPSVPFWVKMGQIFYLANSIDEMAGVLDVDELKELTNAMLVHVKQICESGYEREHTPEDVKISLGCRREIAKLGHEIEEDLD